ncbi:MAG: hypothetical protein ACK5OP_13970 [Sphingobacteriales bacterium]|jgi:hypothetical protein
MILTFATTISLLFALLTTPKQENFCSCWPLEKPEQEFKRSELVMVGQIIQSERYRAAGNLTSNRQGIKLKNGRYIPDSSEYIKHTVLVVQKFKSPPGLADTIYIIAKPAENCGPYIESHSLAVALQFPNLLRYLFYVDPFQEYMITTTLKGKKSSNAIEKIKHKNIFLAEPCRRNQLATDKVLAEINQVLSSTDAQNQKQTP